MKNTNKISYGLYSLVGICAVLAVAFLATPAIAHGQDDYGYGGGDYGSYGGGDYGYTGNDYGYAGGGDYGNYVDSSAYQQPTYSDYQQPAYSDPYAGYSDNSSVYQQPDYSGYSDSYADPYGAYGSETFGNYGGNSSVDISVGYSPSSGYSSAPVYSYSSPAPVYSYGGYGSASYGSSYGSSYYPPVTNPVSPLRVSCYPSTASVYAGNTVVWNTSISGGSTYSYNVTWAGDEGLSGNGTSISKTYVNPGTKNASVRVVSGGQTATANCSSLNVTSASTYTNPGSSYYYGGSSYYSNPSYYGGSYYQPISASCVANTSYANIGSTVTWSAAVTGGNGSYTYAWYGTDGLYGNNQSTSFAYNTAGTKTAYVVISSNGQNYTAYCTNSVAVSANYVAKYVISTNGLDIGCFADPTNADINQPITWTSEVLGGVGPYKYTWTGSNDLIGTQSSIIKSYGTSGEKNAIVTITSADGRTGTRACSNKVTVRGAGTSAAGTNVNTNGQQPENQPNNGLSAASIFSFNNVPWGWIAVLVILVLFGTVMYLLFNRQKI
jgi:hypothetical protein